MAERLPSDHSGLSCASTRLRSASIPISMTNETPARSDAGGVGPLGVEALDPVVDVERGRLGPAEDVARDDEQGAELAERAGDGQRHAVGQAPADRRQGDPPEGPPAARAEGVGDLLLVDAELAEDRHDLADDERQGHEHRRQDHARPGVDDPDARRLRASGRASPCGP